MSICMIVRWQGDNSFIGQVEDDDAILFHERFTDPDEAAVAVLAAFKEGVERERALLAAE